MSYEELPAQLLNRVIRIAQLLATVESQDTSLSSDKDKVSDANKQAATEKSGKKHRKR